VILGGKDKGSDYTPLAAPLANRAEKVLLIGKAARIIFDQLPTLADRMVYAHDLKDAVDKGYRILQKRGGAVLLAPACASFDMFRNYEHRGEVFAAAVLDLKAREAHG
jgi:UDP-N-acetylmuramoylalanine--D-glutamate ligase